MDVESNAPTPINFEPDPELGPGVIVAVAGSALATTRRAQRQTDAAMILNCIAFDDVGIALTSSLQMNDQTNSCTCKLYAVTARF
jgi:hypothetical protein